MTKIININTGMVREIEKPELTKCSICDTDFSLKDEGGIQGYFGMLLTSFCPFCLSSVLDMSKQLLGIEDDEDA